MKRHTYTILGSGIDFDGWHKFWLKRDDGRVVKVSRSRLDDLRRRDQIDGGDTSYHVDPQQYAAA